MAKVTLRPIRTSDADLCYRWVSDPDVTRHLGLLQPPSTVSAERSWIAKMIADQEYHRVFVIEDENGRPIGTCGLRAIDRQEGSALLGIMIGEKSRWDQGYGTAATRSLVGHAFGELGLRQVRLACHADNRRALRCYQKAGFTIGPHRSGEGVYGRTEVQMVIERETWERGPGDGGEPAHRPSPA